MDISPVVGSAWNPLTYFRENALPAAPFPQGELNASEKDLVACGSVPNLWHLR